MSSVFSSRATEVLRYLFPAFLGLAALLLVTGGNMLAPGNVSWLQHQDLAQSYLGWAFYRHDPWGWPLGAHPSYGLEFHSSVYYSDSIPLMAIAGLMATVSATLPVNPALRARSCGVDPSDPLSPSRFRLFIISSVCHCAASCSCGLTVRLLVHPAWRCMVYTLDTTLLLNRELSA